MTERLEPDADSPACLIEIYRIGDAVKVTAVDPRSGLEVSISGPASAGLEALKRVAVRKLAYRLRRAAGD